MSKLVYLNKPKPSRFFVYLACCLSFSFSSIALSENLDRGISGKSAISELNSDSQYSSDRILIKFKPSAIEEEESRAPITGGGAVPKKTTALSRGNDGLTLAASNALATMGVEVVKSFNKVGISSAKVHGDVGVAIEKLWRSGLVEFVELDYVRKASAVPNDPYFSFQWGLTQSSDTDIDAPEYWGDIRKTAVTSVVGVIDTGIDYTHEDLVSVMWSNPGEIPGDGVDNDGNGYIDDIHGIDAYNYDSDPMDDNGHGTHVAGTIGARGNNGIGVSGVSWSTPLMALKFLGSDGSGFTSDAIELINYVIDIKNANNYDKFIINASFGGSGYSASMFDALKDARDNQILFVAAAGNEALNLDDSPHYPSSYDLENIISVGASDSSEDLAYFSNYGCAGVDVIAPGVDIFSTIPGDSYAFFNGTSMAAPHVSGMAAMLWSQTHAPWRRIKGMIMNGSEHSASYSEKAVTQGRVNLVDSLAALAKPAIFSATPYSSGSGEDIVIRGNDFGSVAGTVEINGTALTVNSWSNYEVSVTTPVGFTTSAGDKVNLTSFAGVQAPAGACIQVASFLTPERVGQTIIPRAWAASAQTSPSFLWVFGGATDWGITGLVEKVRLQDNATSVIDSAWMMPTPVTDAGAAAVGKKVYIVGGYSSSSFDVIDTLQIFDTESYTWSEGAAMPEALWLPSVVAVGDKIIVSGGIQDDFYSMSTSNYIYDTVSDSWSTGASLPKPLAFSSSIRFASSDRLWLMGGFENDAFWENVTDTVLQYDLSDDAWTVQPSLDQARAGFAAQYHYKPLVTAGESSNGTVGSFERFNNGGWEPSVTGDDLYAPNSGKKSGYLYYMNGRNSYGGFSSDIYRVKPQ